MLFVDYVIHLIGENIMFDDELSATSIKILDGDKFVAKVVDNKVTLFKVKDTVQTNGE